MKYTIKTDTRELKVGDRVLTPGSNKVHTISSIAGNKVKVKGSVVIASSLERVLDNMMEAIR